MQNSGFQVSDEDVVAAAAALGHDVDLDAAHAMLLTLGADDLASIESAAMDADDLDAQADLARARLGEALVAKGAIPAPSPR